MEYVNELNHIIESMYLQYPINIYRYSLGQIVRLLSAYQWNSSFDKVLSISRKCETAWGTFDKKSAQFLR